MAFVSCNAIKCVSITNQKCSVRPAKMNFDSNELSFYSWKWM